MDRQQGRIYLYTAYDLNDVKEVVSATGVKHYAYIFHNKDEGKEPHYHLIVRYKTCYDLSTLFNRVRAMRERNGRTVMVEICQSLSASYDYLTHKNDPDKFQYLASEIHGTMKAADIDENAELFKKLNLIARYELTWTELFTQNESLVWQSKQLENTVELLRKDLAYQNSNLYEQDMLLTELTRITKGRADLIDYIRKDDEMKDRIDVIRDVLGRAKRNLQVEKDREARKEAQKRNALKRQDKTRIAPKIPDPEK
jgi:hypothetical protein